jgi:hypothetical protein
VKFSDIKDEDRKQAMILLEKLLNEYEMTAYEDNGDIKGDYYILEMLSQIWSKLSVE